MKKNSTKGYVILGILFALVSIIAFAVPLIKTATFWIAYVFTAVAFAAQIIIWNKALGKEDFKSKFLGLPVVHIGIVYAIIQAAAFAVFMYVPTLPIWSAIIACSAIAGVFAACMISVDAGRNEIERVEAKVQEETVYIRELQTAVELLADAETDTDIKAELTKFAEKIRFSDPKSNEQLENLEKQILAKITEFKTESNKTEIIVELNLLLNERNKRCKILK